MVSGGCSRSLSYNTSNYLIGPIQGETRPGDKVVALMGRVCYVLAGRGALLGPIRAPNHMVGDATARHAALPAVRESAMVDIAAPRALVRTPFVADRRHGNDGNGEDENGTDEAEQHDVPFSRALPSATLVASRPSLFVKVLSRDQDRSTKLY